MLAALNEPQTGSMGGMPSIDSMCNKQAKQAGYHSLKFHALIADDYNDITSLTSYKKRNLPIANTRVSVKGPINLFMSGAYTVQIIFSKFIRLTPLAENVAAKIRNPFCFSLQQKFLLLDFYCLFS